MYNLSPRPSPIPRPLFLPLFDVTHPLPQCLVQITKLSLIHLLAWSCHSQFSIQAFLVWNLKLEPCNLPPLARACYSNICHWATLGLYCSSSLSLQLSLISSHGHIHMHRDPCYRINEGAKWMLSGCRLPFISYPQSSHYLPCQEVRFKMTN